MFAIFRFHLLRIKMLTYSGRWCQSCVFGHENRYSFRNKRTSKFKLKRKGHVCIIFYLVSKLLGSIHIRSYHLRIKMLTYAGRWCQFCLFSHGNRYPFRNKRTSKSKLKGKGHVCIIFNWVSKLSDSIHILGFVLAIFRSHYLRIKMLTYAADGANPVC